MSKVESRKRQRKVSTSDSDDDDDQSSRKIYSDGFDDKYAGDAKDRAWLKKLSEREREAELLKRREQREALEHREEISKKLKSRLKKQDNHDDDNSDNDLKSKSDEFDSNIYANEEEDDDLPSNTNRKQTNALKQQETQHSISLKLLVEQRKKKEDETKKKSTSQSSTKDTIAEKLNTNKKLDVSDVFSSDSEDESNSRKRSRSPDEKQKERKNAEEAKRKRTTFVENKSQLKSIVLSRFRLEKWCYAPFFNDVVKGAFVRVNIGQNQGSPVYRVCEILDVVATAKVYSAGSTNTNKGLRLRHGRNERVFRIKFVSNTEMSSSEFQRWLETSQKYKTPLPTLDHIERKKKQIEKYKDYALTNRQISKIVEEKRRFRQVPINYAVTKQELLNDIEIAKEANDKKKETELRTKLDELEQRATKLDNIRTANNSILAEINQRNRKRTQQNVEDALVRKARHRDLASDPFTRRPCAPKLAPKAVQTTEELIRELKRVAEEEKSKKKAEEQRIAEEQKKTKPASMFASQISVNKLTSSDNRLPIMTTRERGSFGSSTNTHDDLFASHDFELDLVI